MSHTWCFRIAARPRGSPSRSICARSLIHDMRGPGVFALMNGEFVGPTLTASDHPRKSLIVEGWRFLPHSYAIVNQWQLLALLRRNIAVKVVDVPFYRSSWQTHEKLFEARAEQALRSIETARPDESADVTPVSYTHLRAHETGRN